MATEQKEFTPFTLGHQKNLAGESQSGIVRCRPLLAIAAMASVAGRVSARPAVGRVGDATLGCRRLRPRPRSRLSRQGRLGIGPSAVWPRAAGPAPAQTRAGSGIALYLHVGAGVRRSRPRGFVRWSRGLGLPPKVSQSIRTC